MSAERPHPASHRKLRLPCALVVGLGARSAPALTGEESAPRARRFGKPFLGARPSSSDLSAGRSQVNQSPALLTPYVACSSVKPEPADDDNWSMRPWREKAIILRKSF